MIAAGYEDGNDADSLRHDPSFKIALERGPETGAALCSQPTISRMENQPDARALIRMSAEMVRFYCQSFPCAPGRVVLDIDDTFDAVHGNQQLRLFNAFYDEYGFQPIVVFDGDGRLVGALLRPARRPKGAESAAHIRRLIRQIRRHWPRTEILLRADSHYCTPQVLDLCDRLGLRYVFGLSRNPRLAENILPLEASTAARYSRNPGQKMRRFKTFSYAARSWSKPRRVIARVEVGPKGRDTRYIVTNLEGGRGKHLYEKNLLRPRPSREPHQGVEGPSRSRPDVVLKSQRQSDAPDVAWLRLLDLVEAPRGLPEAFPVAPRPVRHAAPEPRQARCHYRREEDPHHRDAAGVLSPARAITLPLSCPRATRTSLMPSPPHSLKHQPTLPKTSNRPDCKTGRRHRLFSRNRAGGKKPASTEN